MEQIPASVPRRLPTTHPNLRYIHPDFTQQTTADLWVSRVTADSGGVPDTFIHIHRLFFHTYHPTHNGTRSRWASLLLGGLTHTFDWMIQQTKYFQDGMDIIVATFFVTILCGLLVQLCCSFESHVFLNLCFLEFKHIKENNYSPFQHI